MEWESDSTCWSHMYPRQGCRAPRRCSGWELEHKDCGGNPGQELLATADRQTEGVSGRRLWWEMPVEGARQPWKQGDTAESCLGGKAITIASLSPHASISSWTIETVAPSSAWHMEQQSRTPPPGASLGAWCTKLQSRTPAKGAPLCAWHTE